MNRCLALFLVVATVGWIGLVPGRVAGEVEEAVVSEVDSLCAQAKAALRAGKGSEAVNLLQKAIGLIQGSGVRNLASFVPKVPKGWTAEEPKTASGTWGAGDQAFQWSNVTCRFKRESDGARATVTITNQPQAVKSQEAMIKMFKNPAYAKMMNQEPNKKIEFLEEKGWTVWKMTEKGRRSQVFALKNSLMLTIEVPGEAEADLERFWKGMDLQGLGSVAGG